MRTKTDPIPCPHCGKGIEPKLIVSWAGKIRSQARQPHQISGPPKVMHKCEYCFKDFSAREIRKHRPRCTKNPNATKVPPRAKRR